MAVSAVTKTALFAVLAITGRVLFYIVTPLWQDYFTPTGSTWVNVHNATNHTLPAPLGPSQSSSHRINIVFLLLGQWGFTTLLFGLALVAILIFAPWKITPTETRFRKRRILLSGFFMGISSLFMNYALSGARTAPYLQALLPNFNIPVQFIMRFILLRKPPSLLKAICAGVVVASEILCLIPTIFPSLESETARQTNGGATGVAGILWPLSIVFSLIPYAIANTTMESMVQEKKPSPETGRDTQIHAIYFLFWWSLFNVLTLTALFWVDLIPGFGTSNSFTDFHQSLLFSLQCQFGAAGCGSEVYMLGWINFLANFIVTLAFPGIMRYSDGANFVMVILALRTPIVLIFWTLFQEHPFIWRPHLSLSTWLSLGAVCMALPAILVYNVGLPGCCKRSRAGEREPLLQNSPERVENRGNDDHPSNIASVST